ncbi:MAG: SDR family NAD(P)-dependent oxidoreductase [Paracoccaceae bacterium]
MTPETLFSLAGKTALVTGGASGIGRMATHGLMAAGADVLIASRKADACAAVADELNGLGLAGRCTGFGGDVSTEDGVAQMVSDVNERTQTLHILMNNAGATWGAPLGQFPFDAWAKVMNVNVAGLFHLTQSLLPMLSAAGDAQDPARVVNVGSVMGDAPMGDGAYSYSASKAAVHHITQTLAKEIAHLNITVNALAPGPFVSKMTAFATADEGMRDKVGQDVPLQRVGSPEDIAGAMQFLCSRAGSYITGAILPLSGGIQVMTAPNLFRSAMGQ